MYPDGIRHIRADKRVNEWKTPGKKTIVRCAVNQRQVVIALTGGELVYFEMDPVKKEFLFPINISFVLCAASRLSHEFTFSCSFVCLVCYSLTAFSITL